MVPPTCLVKKISGGQQEEEQGLVHQGEHPQSYLLDDYKKLLLGVPKPFLRLDLIDPRSS